MQQHNSTVPHLIIPTFALGSSDVPCLISHPFPRGSYTPEGLHHHASTANRIHLHTSGLCGQVALAHSGSIRSHTLGHHTWPTSGSVWPHPSHAWQVPHTGTHTPSMATPIGPHWPAAQVPFLAQVDQFLRLVTTPFSRGTLCLAVPARVQFAQRLEASSGLAKTSGQATT